MPTPLDSLHLGLGWFFVVLHAYVPFKAWQARAKFAGLTKLPPRSQHYVGTMISQVFMLIISLAMAYVFGLALYPRVLPTAFDLLLGALALAAMLAFMMPRWRRAVMKGSRGLYFFMPTGPKEKALWVGVAAAAGFCEETTYRGVLTMVLVALTGNLWFAVPVSALIFAGAHAFQSRRSMVIIFFFSLIFQGLAIKSGALYVSMLVHFLYDVTAGFRYSRLGRELDYRAEGAPEAASSVPAAG